MSSATKDHTAIVAALITAAAVVIAALIGAGLLDDDADGGSNVEAVTTRPTTPDAETTSPRTSRPPTTEARPTTSQRSTATIDRVDVELVYAGDTDGCSLDIQVAIGDQLFVPSGSSFVMSDVLVGQQPYELGGVISCPTWGACEAYGSGWLDVTDGGRFDVSWANTDIGICGMALS